MMVKLSEDLHVNLNCVTRAVKAPHQTIISDGTYFDLIHALGTGAGRKLDELYTLMPGDTVLRHCANVKKLEEALPQMYHVTYVEGTKVRTVLATEDYCKKFLDITPTDESAKEAE